MHTFCAHWLDWRNVFLHPDSNCREKDASRNAGGICNKFNNENRHANGGDSKDAIALLTMTS